MSGIYVLHDNGNLVEMMERSYDSEDLLQGLLATYPSLLGEIGGSATRRWLLISREMGIPGEEGGGERWSLDHLFLDQDAVPTFVEVKRSRDTRIRREVVGQMLDYAANAVVYWPAENIRTRFESRCEEAGQNAGEVLLQVLGEPNAAEFWQGLKTNLQAGRIRMVFVADLIPAELRRIVEFLNSQMDPAEVLAVEIRQYVGAGLKSLVPRVFGHTANADSKKTQGPAPRWDQTSFLAAARAQLVADRVLAVERILTLCEGLANELGWGRGSTPSFSPKFLRVSNRSFFTLNAAGALTINRKWHESPEAGPRAAAVRDAFVERLQSAGLDVPTTAYPILDVDTWAPNVEALAAAITEVVAGS
jgi:hypothetical protein